jgi:hypothetical protein
VQDLFNAIECLTKRLWSDHFSAEYRGQLAAVLHGKLQSLSELQRRFAQVALSLHNAYRNPVAHDLDNFRCSVEEARFFVAGVRVMLDLYERIASGNQ